MIWRNLHFCQRKYTEFSPANTFEKCALHKIEKNTKPSHCLVRWSDILSRLMLYLACLIFDLSTLFLSYSAAFWYMRTIDHNQKHMIAYSHYVPCNAVTLYFVISKRWKVVLLYYKLSYFLFLAFWSLKINLVALNGKWRERSVTHRWVFCAVPFRNCFSGLTYSDYEEKRIMVF